MADIICIDYVRTVIGQTSKSSKTAENNINESRERVEPFYITCMTITILGAVLAVVSRHKVPFANDIIILCTDLTKYDRMSQKSALL